MSEIIGVRTTSEGAYWRDVDVDPVPTGMKVMLLTRWGIAVFGNWYADGEFVAWSPLPKIPGAIKEKMGFQRSDYDQGDGKG